MYLSWNAKRGLECLYLSKSVGVSFAPGYSICILMPGILSFLYYDTSVDACLQDLHHSIPLWLHFH
jgi:hypothetical protein